MTRTIEENSKEHYRLETVKEYAFVTANQFSSEEILATEQLITKRLGMRLQIPTMINYFEIFMILIGEMACLVHCSPFECTDPSRQLERGVDRGQIKTRFLFELLATDVSYSMYPHSVLAASCMALAFASEHIVLNRKTKERLDAELGQQRKPAFESCIKWVDRLWRLCCVPNVTKETECPLKKYIQKYGFNPMVPLPPKLNLFQDAWFSN